MKIYQIHQYGGEWEDAYDIIISSYLSEEKAQAELERLEDEEANSPSCYKCPLYYCPDNCDLECGSEECKEQALRLVKEFCKEYEPSKDGKCKNFYYKTEAIFYRIETENVIE